MSFTAEQKQIILYRDGNRCCMCGATATDANHRLNRGMGGRASLDIIENGCAICFVCNSLIESDAAQASLARVRGVKLTEGQDPRVEPWLSPFFGIPVWSLPNGDLTFEAPTGHKMMIVDGEIEVCDTCENSEGNPIAWKFAHPGRPPT